VKRERIRYIVFEILCGHEVRFRSLTSAIWSELYTLFGENGTSKTGLWLVTLAACPPEGDLGHVADKLKIYRGILRTNEQSTGIIRITLAFITEIDRNSALIQVLGVSGTIKTAQRKYLMPCTPIPNK
jgi:ribonuclease P/MRP protein subunit POP5